MKTPKHMPAFAIDVVLTRNLHSYSVMMSPPKIRACVFDTQTCAIDIRPAINPNSLPRAETRGSFLEVATDFALVAKVTTSVLGC